MENDTSKFEIRFNDLPPSEATIQAVQLRDALLETDSEVTVEIVKDDKNTMDMGATIVLILGTPAAIAISKGIADYIRRAGVTVTVSSDEKEVTIKNMKSEDVANSLKAIFSKK